MIYESQEELDAGVAKWAKVLRLQDWDITAKICVQREFTDGDSVWGRCHPKPKKKDAYIQIRDQADYLNTVEEHLTLPRDMEVDLVHEMLHIHFQPFEPDEEGPEWTAMEAAIETLARALVKLDRWEMSVPTVNGQVSFAEKREKVKA